MLTLEQLFDGQDGLRTPYELVRSVGFEADLQPLGGGPRRPYRIRLDVVRSLAGDYEVIQWTNRVDADAALANIVWQSMRLSGIHPELKRDNADDALVAALALFKTKTPAPDAPNAEDLGLGDQGQSGG